jgi:ADP-heptose:LPS heptosyltransferase
MNILVVRFSALGDLVTLEPIFRAIKFFYPKSNIDFLTSSIGKDLYIDTNYFDNYIIHKDYINTIKKLREKKYDVVYNLHCNTLSHILILFVKKRLVSNSAASLWQKLMGIKIKVRPISLTLINSGLDINEVEKYFLKKESLIVSLPAKDTKISKTNKKIVIISTGSSVNWKSKQWGLKKYEYLIELLINDNIQIVLIGSNLEVEDSNVLAKKFPEIINYVNKTNLTSLKSVLKNADVYLGNDSGPSHIAAALGVNTVTIFGPTDIKHCVKFADYSGTHKCIKPNKNIICHPCYKGICPTKLECMQSIDVSYVYDNIKQLLNLGKI